MTVGQTTQTDSTGQDAGRRQDTGRRKRSYKPRARRCACGCGQMLTPKAPHGRFASDNCRKRDHRRRMAKARKTVPVAPVLELRICLHCGATFFAETGKNACYCSPSHKTAAWRIRREGAIKTLAADRATTVEKARDAVDRHGLAKATKYLHAHGFQYDHQARMWMKGGTGIHHEHQA